jgi:hypothetical protein
VLQVPCKTGGRLATSTAPRSTAPTRISASGRGLTGGKGVPAAVAAHPYLSVTLTAPSFGAVHSRRERNGKTLPCHPRRDGGTCPHGQSVSCGEHHHPDDSRIGTRICGDCYDYTGSVLFNAVAPELWRRFTITLRRALARLAGIAQATLKEQARISCAKVAEYQKRGVVHFHAVIGLDGPDRPSTPPLGWATADLLTDAITAAVDSVKVKTPDTDKVPSQTLSWGAQLDIRPVSQEGELTDNARGRIRRRVRHQGRRVCTGTLDRRLTRDDKLDELPVSPHARRLIAECLRIGQVPDLAELRTAEWAHMLGFRGHFSTKRRAYSTTLGALRDARADYAWSQHPDDLPAESTDTVLVVSDWIYT